MKSLKALFTALLLLCCTVVSAYDFQVNGIYYNILSNKNKTVEVTYRGENWYSISNEYSGDVTIPENVTYDGTSYSVTTIGDYAFSSSHSLTSIEIPNSVTTIGSGAFSSCSSLTSITVAAGNTTYDSRDNCNAIIETATNTLISGCQNTVIPNGVTAIGGRAFSGCSNLTSIEIPNGVTAIGDRAFSSCSNLTSIEIPNSVTTIGSSAFYGCSNLTSITIPNSVTTIGEYAFCQCNKLVNIKIPNSVTTIEFGAFGVCSSLESITIPSSVVTIESAVFIGCKNLEAIVVDKDNKHYDSRNNCNAIIETESNTLISGCKNTIIPNSVIIIDEYAFYYCTSLESITIPNSVTTIKYNAFLDCHSLTSIEIPSSVTTIVGYAFCSCKNLTSITSHIPADKLFTIDTSVFYNVNSNCTLYVPYGAKETYATTEGWNEFTNIVELPAESFDLTVSAAKYATLYLDYNAIIPNGVEVYTANTIEGNKLMLQQVTDVLPANTAAIVRAEQGTYEFTKSDEEVSAIENNLLRGSVEDEYITPEKNAKYYVLAMKDGVVGMYEDALSGGIFKNNAHKAYLVLKANIGIYDEEVNTQNPGVQLGNSYYFDFSGTTAIDPVVTEINDNIYYDLSGRRVENPTSGIYILNGNKVLVK